MTFGGEQHVGEPAEHMRPDCLALIGAGHYCVVSADAEMIRPEPNQALDEADVCRDGGVVMSLCLAEKVLSRWIFGLRRRRSDDRLLRFCGVRHRGIIDRGISRRCIVGDELRGPLFCSRLTSRREPLTRQARGIELENDTTGGAATK
jgi:hypothetical protein